VPDVAVVLRSPAARAGAAGGRLAGFPAPLVDELATTRLGCSGAAGGMGACSVLGGSAAGGRGGAGSEAAGAGASAAAGGVGRTAGAVWMLAEGELTGATAVSRLHDAARPATSLEIRSTLLLGVATATVRPMIPAASKSRAATATRLTSGRIRAPLSATSRRAGAARSASHLARLLGASATGPTMT
jgi:hypothetical protein